MVVHGEIFCPSILTCREAAMIELREITKDNLDEVLNLALTKPRKSPKSKNKVVEIQESNEETATTICC